MLVGLGPSDEGKMGSEWSTLEGPAHRLSVKSKKMRGGKTREFCLVAFGPKVQPM